MARSRVKDAIDLYNQFTPEEQALFLDFVAPLPEPEPQMKQTRKKRGKSAKAQSLSDAITKTPKAEVDTDPKLPIETDGPKCGTCGNPEDFQDHFKPSPNFHEFEAPKGKATKAAAK